MHQPPQAHIITPATACNTACATPRCEDMPSAAPTAWEAFLYGALRIDERAFIKESPQASEEAYLRRSAPLYRSNATSADRSAAIIVRA